VTKTGSSESSAQRSFSIEHTSLGTGLSYDALIRVFERELRYLDPGVVQRLAERKAAWTEIESEITKIAIRTV
jgi:hypothetical protein